MLANLSIYFEAVADDKIIKQLREGEKLGKNLLKIDCIIIATAVTKKATCIYSNDEGMKKLAQGYIEVKEVPNSL